MRSLQKSPTSEETMVAALSIIAKKGHWKFWPRVSQSQIVSTLNWCHEIEKETKVCHSKIDPIRICLSQFLCSKKLPR